MSMHLLRELVAVDSSTRESANSLIEHCAKYLKSSGIEGEILDNNGYKSYVAFLGTAGADKKTLVLNGHVDVVSAKTELFEPIEKEGRLYGRGTADMKAGCVAIIETCIQLKDKALDCNVMLQLVSDEETGGMNCSKFLAESGYIGDFVICTEPTQMQPSIQSKGILRVDIITKGKSAHGSRPWEGSNAIIKAYEIYKKIENLPLLKEGSEFYEGSTVNLAFIQGGDAYNKVPDTCKMGLDIRFVPHLEAKTIVEAIKNSIEDSALTVLAEEPGVFVKPDHPYVELVLDSLKEIMPDHEAKLVAQHGGSDARFFAAKGIPAIEFGPAGDHWHGNHEYVEIESIENLVKVLIHIAENFK